MSENTIKVPAAAIWLFYLKNLSELKHCQMLVAKCEDRETELYVTDDNGKMCLNLYYSGEYLCSEVCTSSVNAEETMSRILQKYFTPTVDDGYSIPDETQSQEQDETMEDYVYEITDKAFMAFKDFIDALIKPGEEYRLDQIMDAEEQYEFFTTILGEIADHDIPVFFPMFVDEGGIEVYNEFPFNP